MIQTGTFPTPPFAPIGFLHDGRDEFCDRAVQIAISHLQADVSLISFFDPAADRMHFKSQVGLAEPWASEGGMALSDSICQHLLRQDTPLVIPDTRNHHLLRDSNVAEDMGIITYIGAPIRDGSGVTIGSVCVVGSEARAWDVLEIASLDNLAHCISEYISARVRAFWLQQLLERSKTEAHARADLLAGLSQDIGIPLNSLLGMVGALDPAALPSSQRAILGSMGQAGDQLRRVSDDLATLVRLEGDAPDLAEVQFHPFQTIESAIGLARTSLPDAAAPIEIDGSTDGEISRETVLIGKEAQIRQVLSNLLENALTSNREGPVRVKPSLQPGGSGTAVLDMAVSDSGPSLPHSVRQAFAGQSPGGGRLQVRPQQEISLGLAIACALCRRHGWDLRIEDAPGGGATFRATFAVGIPQT